MTLRINRTKNYQSHGTGNFSLQDFGGIGEGVVLEARTQVFHPENIFLGNNIYIGHGTILKGYHKNAIRIGDDTWIGQSCFFHGAGGLTIGRAVGIGPKVSILTSQHSDNDLEIPILHQELVFKEVTICDGSDIGLGSIILPGVVIGEGAVVGAGSVVTHNVEPYTVVAGSPARMIRRRGA
jgi:acetyltransferase-like isoleucine patch superfamily enzyme